MKYLAPLVVALFLINTASALIQTQSIGNGAVRNTAEVEPETQFTETGKAYKHGHWCIDSRVF